MLNIYDRFHIFRSQRLEIQLVRNIEVGTYGLRVIIDDNGIIPLWSQEFAIAHAGNTQIFLTQKDGYD